MWDGSSLLASKAAFTLGRVQDVAAIPALKAALCDLSLHPIVRHKVAVTLLFIWKVTSQLWLSSLPSDPALLVRETCEVAWHRIKEIKNASPRSMPSNFPVEPKHCASVPESRKALFSEESTLYECLCALMSLSVTWHFLKTEEAIPAIFESWFAKSTLLR